MSIILRIYKYFKKINKTINYIYIYIYNEGVSKAYLWLDYLFCFLKYGCLIDQYHRGSFYKLSPFVRKRSFTQRRLEQIIGKYNTREGIRVLENKNEFNKYFSKYVTRKWIYAKEMKFIEFVDLYSTSSRLFVKPINAQEGVGVYSINTNAHPLRDIFEELRGHNIIIEEAILQHEKMNLGNVSVNSLRLITVLDTKGIAHVVRAGLRAGVGDSIIDNFTAGGVLYEIDLETGIVDNKGICGENYNVIFHPNTTTCMLGFQIPNWAIAIKAVKESAEQLPQCRFIGWDVAVTNNGVELIEGNHNPGIFTMESLGNPGAYADVIRLLNL